MSDRVGGLKRERKFLLGVNASKTRETRSHQETSKERDQREQKERVRHGVRRETRHPASGGL